MSMDTELYDILTADSGILAIVSGRISPVYDPVVGETRDRLVYQQVGGAREYDCDGQGPARGRFQITAWSATHAGASALSEAVRSAVSGYHDTGDGVLFIVVENQGDMPALDANEQAQQYGKYIDIRMTFKET